MSDKYEEVFLRALERRLPDFEIALLRGDPHVAIIEFVKGNQISEMSGHWRGANLRAQVNAFVNAVKVVFEKGRAVECPSS